MCQIECRNPIIRRYFTPLGICPWWFLSQRDPHHNYLPVLSRRLTLSCLWNSVRLILFITQLSLTPVVVQNSYIHKSPGHLVWNADSLVPQKFWFIISWVGLLKSSGLRSSLSDSSVGGPLTCFNTLCTILGNFWLETEALLDRNTTQKDGSVT